MPLLSPIYTLIKTMGISYRLPTLTIHSNHPGLSEINAPIGSKEVMSLMREHPLQTIAGCSSSAKGLKR